jgi:hypothetical protein
LPKRTDTRPANGGTAGPATGKYCLFDWQNLYNSPWRIRPVYIFNDRTHFIQHIKGGMAHWIFKF